MPTDNQIAFAQAVESLPTLLQFDIVFITERTNQLLLENINRDGVILMNKFDEKLEKFANQKEKMLEQARQEAFRITRQAKEEVDKQAKILLNKIFFFSHCKDFRNNELPKVFEQLDRLLEKK